MSRTLAAFAAALCAACTSASPPPPAVATQAGPSRDAPIRRIVALQASCGSLLTAGVDTTVSKKRLARCRRGEREAADAAVRLHLESVGYRVVDSDRVNAATGTRYERRTYRSWGDSEVLVEVTGVRFEDAPPRLQDEILADLEADGLLQTRIWIGAGHGFSMRRQIEVMVSLVHVPSGELVQASRCRIEAGLEPNGQPIAEAARCAAEALEGTP